MKYLLFMLLSLFLTPLLQAETWKIASLEWPPYAGKKIEGGGTAIVALREVLQKQNIVLEVEYYPWERAQDYARKPEYVGYFPAWPEEVDKGFMGSESVQNSTIGLLYREGMDVKWSSIDDLISHNRVGLIKSYTYPKAIESTAKKYPKNVDHSRDEETMVKKLSNGRMNIAITDPKVMLYYAKKLNITNIKASDQIIEEKALVVSFADRDDNKARLKLLNSLLKSR